LNDDRFKAPLAAAGALVNKNGFTPLLLALKGFKNWKFPYYYVNHFEKQKHEDEKKLEAAIKKRFYETIKLLIQVGSIDVSQSVDKLIKYRGGEQHEKKSHEFAFNNKSAKRWLRDASEEEENEDYDEEEYEDQMSEEDEVGDKMDVDNNAHTPADVALSEQYEAPFGLFTALHFAVRN